MGILGEPHITAAASGGDGRQAGWLCKGEPSTTAAFSLHPSTATFFCTFEDRGHGIGRGKGEKDNPSPPFFYPSGSRRDITTSYMY